MKLKQIQALFCKKKRGKSLQAKLRKISKDQRIMAVLLSILGTVNIGGSIFYQPVDYKMIDVRTISAAERLWKSTAVSTPSEAESAELDKNSRFLPLDEMNLFHIFPEDAADHLPASSIGGQIFKELTDRDLDWAGAVYSYSRLTPEEMTEKMGISKACIIGAYNPENQGHIADDPSTWTIDRFRNVWFLTEDGDGNSISPYSNISQIMSLANVYFCYQDPKDQDAFLAYCKELWKASHYYTLTISDIYHCAGCVRKNVAAGATSENVPDTTEKSGSENMAGETEKSGSENMADETEKSGSENMQGETGESGRKAENAESDPGNETNGYDQEEQASETGESSTVYDTEGIGGESGPEPASEENEDQADAELFCPGHVDLTITLKIAGLSEEHNLFTLDASGNDGSRYTQNGWMGWTEENRQAALCLAQKDWYLEYGLRTELSSPQLSVSTVDVDAYLKQLPPDLSEERRKLLSFALHSVGRVPYYWGGKPSAAGYEGNNFGTTVSPDAAGRSLKGLDCSGWISWIYWSATGKRLFSDSTTGLAATGRRISKEELKPGDILVRTGKDAHTVLFLGWTQDGKIRCVHETSGSVNNVTISIRDADWPYYIRLME